MCTECLQSLRKNLVPFAAMANGLWFGQLPEHLQNCNFVELAAASAVRTSDMINSFEQLKVGGIPGSAQPLLRGTFTFYSQDAYGVQLQLPICDTDTA